MRKEKRIFCLSVLSVVMLCIGSCSKSAFDINSPNPNLPSNVPPNYVLSAALTASANLIFGGDQTFADFWMGYWAPYGEQSPAVLSYNLTTDTYSANWDDAYIVLENYKFIIDQSAAPEMAYYKAIAKIMESYHYQALVDLYNNIPYREALQSENSFPGFDSAQSVYKDLIVQLDSAVTIINAADPNTVEDPASYDVVFQGSMDKWIKFSHTLKLKILMHQTQVSGGPAYIQSNLSGLTLSDFFGVGDDVTVNPGYSNSTADQQNPLWRSVGYTTNGAPSSGYLYTRANSYAVNFYLSTNDPRVGQYYLPNSANIYRGRAFGSSDVGQGGDNISGFGTGFLSDATQGAYILPAFESLFIEAEAAQRGFIQGDPSALFKEAVTESFRLLAVPDYQNAAQTYYSQANALTNFDLSGDKITTLITQKWAALNAFDPLEAYSDWRRLGIPADLPVSVYPGTTAAHIPYRLLYPSSEYHYNQANVDKQGTINQFTSQIFWMP